MNAATPDATLAGNGIIAPDKAPSDAFRGALEPLLARAYGHAGLPGRVLVKLVQDRVVASEDATLGVLGFAPTVAVSPVVGQAKRRAIGFPAAAIVKAPELARYALEITKDFQREARRIKSKPGHAMQGFGRLADELQRSVPAFLTSFWEEAGRAFLLQAASDQAAQCFGKARDSENIHALTVDEDERHEAFLEFALAGGLSIKTLTEYAKTLAKEHAPGEAYRRFRALCRERTLGGLPPFAGMAKELQRLAKAAKLDAAAEERELLVEMLQSPAVMKAAMGFWEAYRKSLVAVTLADPQLLGRLLDLKFEPSSPKEDTGDTWLSILEECNAFAVIEDARLPGQPKGGAAKAFNNLVALANLGWRNNYPPAGLLALLRRMAPRLVADGTPLDVAYGRWGKHWDVDLLETALALGVPVFVAEVSPKTHEYVSFELNAWAKHVADPGRGVDPVLVAADPRFAGPLRSAVGIALSRPEFQVAAHGKRGFEAAKRSWIEGLLGPLENGGLRAADLVIARMRGVAHAGLFDGAADLYARLAAFDLVPTLTRTLRGGLPDELVWPAWEAAVSELGPKAELVGPPPTPILSDGKSVIVLGPNGVELRHDLRLEKGETLRAARYIGGDLLVSVSGDAGVSIYWASKPTERHPLADVSRWSQVKNTALGVAIDGTWCEGPHTPLRKGDLAFPETARVFSDGQTIWVHEWHESEWRTRELDPQTGKRHRESLPAFFAAHVDPHHVINESMSTLGPLPLAPGHVSPLGTRDGLAGWVAVRPEPAPDGFRFEGIGVDGRRCPAPTFSNDPDEAHRGMNEATLAGLVTFPGRADGLPLGYSESYRGNGTISLCAADGTYVLALVGEHHEAAFPWSTKALALLPLPAWHYLSPRSLASSQALRALDEAAVRALYDAVAAAGDKVVTAAQVAPHLPGVTDETLRTMVAERARHAVARKAELVAVLASTAPRDDVAPSAPISTRQAREALNGFGFEVSWGDGDLGVSARHVLQALVDSSAPLLRLGGIRDAMPGIVFQLIGRGAALAVLATSAGYEEHREILLGLLQTYAVTLPKGLRIQRRDVGATALREHIAPHELVRRAAAPNVLYYISEDQKHEDRARLYELALDGQFPALAGVASKVDEDGMGVDETWAVADDAAWCRRVIELVRERGAAPWEGAMAERLAALTGLSQAEAGLVCLGLPGIASHERNFLPKALREAMGLKVEAALVARDALRARVPVDDRLALIAALRAEAPEALWTPLTSGVVERVAAFWNQRYGRRAQIDEALAMRAKKELEALRLEPLTALGWLAEPGGKDYANDVDAQRLCGLVGYMAWCAAELPVGDPVRAGIPVMLAALREALAGPDLEIEWGHLHGEHVEALVAALPGDLTMVANQAAKDAGVVRVGANRAWLRPGRMGEPGAADVVGSLRGAIYNWYGDACLAVEAAP